MGRIQQIYIQIGLQLTPVCCTAFPIDGSTARRCTAIVTNERARLSSVRKKPRSASHSFVLQNTIVQGSANIDDK